MLNHIWYRLEGHFKVFGTIYLAKPAWSVDNVPDLTGKVALVTGGNSGLSIYI